MGDIDKQKVKIDAYNAYRMKDDSINIGSSSSSCRDRSIQVSEIQKYGNEVLRLQYATANRLMHGTRNVCFT